MERQITTSEIVRAGTDALRNSIYVAMPGSVVTYYPATQTADVQPMTNDVRFDLNTGAIVFEKWQVIKQVPICWPRMGGFTIAGYLNADDPVLLEAFDLDPGPWRAQGRSSNPTNPQDVRRLGGNYWRATPTDLTGPIASAPTQPGLVIGQDGQPAQIVLAAGKIQLGQSGGDFVALASKVNTAIKAWAVWAASGTGSGYVPPTPATQPTGGTVSTGSTLVGAQ